MEAAAAIMSHYDKLCCSVTQNGNILKVLSTCKKENDCRMQHYYPTVQHRAGVAEFMTHEWHSPYLRREQDTPGRGSRTARSSWLVSPLTAHQCHCVWSLVLGWQLLYCNCGLTTALLPASGHRSGQHAVSAPYHWDPALSHATHAACCHCSWSPANVSS